MLKIFLSRKMKSGFRNQMSLFYLTKKLSVVSITK